jgi:hypothetical protein
MSGLEAKSTTRPNGRGPDSSLTAVCVSIDRIPQNTAPMCCLSFDEIGARHPGMTHDAGAESPVRSSFPLSCHPQKPRVYPLRELRLTNNTSDRKANGESDSRPVRGQRTGRLMPRCRDAGPQYDQKVNNELGPYSVGYGLSKRKQL